MGNRLTETRNSATDHYAYSTDSNRLNSITGVFNKSYSYDANGNTISDGIFKYRYGDHNRLLAVTNVAGASVAEYAYNASNQRIKKTFDSSTTYYHYGPNGRLIAERDRQGNPIAEYFYLGSQPIAINATAPEPIADDSGTEFSFTGKWRLSSSLPGYYGSGYHQINSKTARGGFKKATWTPGVQLGEYAVFARWPADLGNIPDAKFTVKHASGSAPVTRDQTQDGGQWVSLGVFVLNPSSRVELSNQSTQKGKVIADAIKLVPTSGPETYYIHTDHLNTPTAITDSNRTVVWSANYDPFGSAQVAGSIAFNLRLPGQYFDQETELQYNYFRDYDPTIGRYIQPDPIGLAGGVNTYSYVANNPLGFIDPQGLLFGGRIDAGESYGESAAQYWADRAVQTGNPLYHVAGALAALWTPDTSDATTATLVCGAGAGRYFARPFWQYYPAENAAYTSGWLTRGWGWKPRYTSGPDAARNLSLPPWNPGTGVRPVNPPWWQPVRGSRPVEPAFGQPGGGAEYYRGWRWP